VYVLNMFNWRSIAVIGTGACLVLLAVFPASVRAESLRNRAELSRPLLSDKRVIAHYMSNMLYYRGSESVPTYDSREHYRLDGPSAAIGGFNQTFPIMDFRNTEMSLDEVAGLELRTAKKMGNDGFQFFFKREPIRVG
jgi:hypothetical protein